MPRASCRAPATSPANAQTPTSTGAVPKRWSNHRPRSTPPRTSPVIVPTCAIAGANCRQMLGSTIRLPSTGVRERAPEGGYPRGPAL